MPPLSAAKGDMREIVVLAPETTFLLRRFEGGNDRKESSPGSRFRTSQKMINLSFGQTLQKRESQQHVEPAVKGIIIESSELEERGGKTVCVFDSPRAEVEPPARLARLTQTADEKAFGAPNVQEGAGPGKHRSEETRRPPEQTRKQLPPVAFAPIALDPSLKVVLIVPTGRNRHGRLHPPGTIGGPIGVTALKGGLNSIALGGNHDERRFGQLALQFDF